MFVTRRKVCVLYKLEGNISVSEGEVSSKFEWWDTTCAPARAQEDLLHSQRRRAPACARASMCLLHLKCLKFAMHTAARRKKRHSLIWKSEGARLGRDTDV